MLAAADAAPVGALPYHTALKSRRDACSSPQ
jgi:hypothetical protein